MKAEAQCETVLTCPRADDIERYRNFREDRPFGLFADLLFRTQVA